MAVDTTKSSSNSSKTYVYTGLRQKDNKRVTRQKVVAPNEQAAVNALKRDGILATEIKEMASGGLNMTIGYDGVKFKYAQKADFARRLYQMLRAGISIPRSLQAIAEDAKPDVAKMCQEMAEVSASGRPLSVAMEDHPRAFDDVFRAYVAAGEASGTLVESLGDLATLLAKRASTQAKIKGVMAYPKMVGGTIVVLVFGIITFLVPSYAKIYAGFDAKLPAPTLALIWLSDHMMPLRFHNISDPIPFIVPIPQPFNVLSIIAYIAIGWIVFKRRTADSLEVGRTLDKIKFKMPVLGSLWHKSSLFQWASTLAGGLSSGVPMTQALSLAAAASGSRWQQLVSVDLEDSVRTGRPISNAMVNAEGLYPPNIRTLVATGEQSGEIAEMLDSAALTLDEEVEALVSGLSAKIEVTLLLVLGVVVGGLLLVLYMPILNLATTASKGLGAG